MLIRNKTNRIAYIDGMRGVAILVVVLYHAYSRWSTVVQFGDQFANWPIIRQGAIGVPLFFMISGFVILSTLRSCKTIGEFLLRRFLRLFPAMLAGSALIYLTAPLLPERPFGPVDALSLVPGLTFMEPAWWTWLSQNPVREMEGAFWSLYVEVRFYWIFGILYFLLGEFRALCVIALLAFLWLVPVESLRAIMLGMGSNFFSWFFLGAFTFRYCTFKRTERLNSFIIAIVVFAIFCAIRNYRKQIDSEIISFLLILVFVAAPRVPSIQRFFENRTLQFLGFVSYPLYLIHENLSVALIVKLGAACPWIPGLLLPVLPIASLTLMAWAIARYVEPTVKSMLMPVYRLGLAVLGGSEPKRDSSTLEDLRVVSPAAAGER
ncbi:MAG: acyltransferase [Ancalomicrobiaceae bacterium]|nr:acyltransferase [Ancalomicrobiaceae bacterium]